MGVICVDFSKAFVTVSHSLLMENVSDRDLDGCTVNWVKKCPDGQAQRVIVNAITIWSQVVLPTLSIRAIF